MLQNPCMFPSLSVFAHRKTNITNQGSTGVYFLSPNLDKSDLQYKVSRVPFFFCSRIRINFWVASIYLHLALYPCYSRQGYKAENQVFML